MATYRGSDGSITVATNSVANVQQWTLDVDRDVLDTTAMADTAKTKTLDLPDARGRFTARLDYGDTAQAALVDQAVANAVPSALAFEFIVLAGKKFTGNLLCAGASVVGQRGQLFDVEFAYEVTGAVGVTWG